MVIYYFGVTIIALALVSLLWEVAKMTNVDKFLSKIGKK